MGKKISKLLFKRAYEKTPQHYWHSIQQSVSQNPSSLYT